MACGGSAIRVKAQTGLTEGLGTAFPQKGVPNIVRQNCHTPVPQAAPAVPGMVCRARAACGILNRRGPPGLRCPQRLLCPHSDPVAPPGNANLPIGATSFGWPIPL